MKNFIEELKWRGMVHDIMPGTEEQLNKEMTIGYIGFDPTADSLGVGNLVQVMTLLHFQQAGHKPIALVGGATGMVGDPSGKSAERNLLSEDILQHNLACQKKQLEKFLNFNCGNNSAEIVNNYDWFKNFSFIEFIRDIGKHLTVNYMLAKDSVKKRLETGMSFTEFSYQLVQGYDFYYLWKNKNVKLQMGGSDQWGNIVSGTELISRKGDGKAFALTTPLIKKTDGTKFGKTESGNIWLDPSRTTPYKFYQFWLNSSDEDAVNYIRIFTLMNKEEIETLEIQHKNAPHERALQKALAKDITIRVHSEDDFHTAVKASELLFGKSTTEDLQSLSEDTLLSILEGIPQVEISHSDYSEATNVTDFLSVTTQSIIFPSKGEARKMIAAGGVSINKNKLSSPDQKVKFDLLFKKYLLIQKGKKNYFLVILK
ncbi:MAG TPA: tyrosine--tRNA ligase [Cytophagaceae bacterium]|jgi:tyrosyl-tRNA synthetase|nr:tyrosine--tRNA ligase [Cytophagaceae bacterium]